MIKKFSLFWPLSLVYFKFIRENKKMEIIIEISERDKPSSATSVNPLFLKYDS